MTTTIAEPVYWSAPKKAGFRFALIFFLSYIFFNPNGAYPNPVAGLLTNSLHNLVIWFAKHILHLGTPITAFTGGSGDTRYDYIMLLLIFALALVATTLWTLLDRKARNYNKLYYWLTVIVRFYLGIMMLEYGFIKIIKLQFPAPSLSRLLQPYGDSSPMGLAWTYIGYSTGFNYFAGIAEVSCGLLLLFRRTAVLGALLGVVVAGNIMVINYCFDVPVKLLSTALVVMSIFLLLRDAERLVNVFILNKTALPANLSPHRFKKRWKNITLIVVKCLIIIYVLAGNITNDISMASHYGDKAPKIPLYGIYNVESFVRNKDTIAPLTTDTNRWSKLVIGYANGAQIKFMNDSSKFLSFKIDTQAHSIVINTYTDTLQKYDFAYTKPKPGVLLLNGKWQQDSLKIKFNRFDEKQFLLMRRGFHWINEQPFNK
jgi:hypothetical protein